MVVVKLRTPRWFNYLEKMEEHGMPCRIYKNKVHDVGVREKHPVNEWTVLEHLREW